MLKVWIGRVKPTVVIGDPGSEALFSKFCFSTGKNSFVESKLELNANLTTKGKQCPILLNQ